MKHKYRPYGINIKYELETYKNIGKDYGNSQTASKGVLFDFLRVVRKYTNKNQKKYNFCDTYSTWKMHVDNILNIDMINYEDFLRWLERQKKEAQHYLDAVKAVLIPIYVSLISLYKVFSGETDSLAFLIFVMAFIAFFSVCILENATEKVEFFDDFIEIAAKAREN